VTESSVNDRLSDQEIRRFFETGWIVRSACFGVDEIAEIRTCYDNLEKRAAGLETTGLHDGSQFVLGERDGQQVLKRVVWAGASQPYLLQIGTDRRLTAPCAQLLGSDEMDHLLNQAHFKRPNDGVFFGWHQDIQHRDKGPGTWDDVNGKGSFVQSLIVIDEMSADSGPVMFVPGSCKWGRVDFGDHDYDQTEYKPHKPPQFREEDAVTILAQPGDVLFFGPYTAHASFENISGNYRRVLINGFAHPGANHRVYPGAGAGSRIAVTKLP
jgi:ectoine hydroxylase-related dioxygenase (phytanoyl-CoA dioxygenase family)